MQIDKIITDRQADRCKDFYVHLYSVSMFCTLLALRRGVDPELAATCGMLHDIYQVTDGIIENHAILGAETAKQMLENIGLYSDEEIEIITTSISTHGKKRKIHDDAYGELLKDADVLSHCLYDTDYPIIEKEVLRFNKLLAEIGCKPEE